MNKLEYLFQIVFTFLILNSSYSSANGNLTERIAEIIFIKDDNYNGQSQFYETIIELGYDADIIEPDSVTLEKLNQYSLVVLSTGNNTMACQSSNMRLGVQAFIIEHSGKVIIEGGHTGYISAVFPFYLGFRNKVIMIDNWVADNGGNLVLSDVFASYDLANVPNKLPSVFTINYSTQGDQDVCTNNKFTQLFYKSSLYSDKTGILVYPTVLNPRVINFFNYYSSFAYRDEAKMLLQNFIFNLIGKPVGINNVTGEIPSGFTLNQNFPNPFNPGTVISYSLRVRSVVSLRIYDVLGNELTSVINKKQNAGDYEYYWEADNLSGGIYFYSLYIDGKLFDTKKMMFLK